LTPTAVQHNITSDQLKRARHGMAAADHAALYPCVDEADALRDEEEAHAGKLRSRRPRDIGQAFRRHAS